MGRKRKKYNINLSDYSFHELDEEYMRNDYGDDMVAALNQLPPDERAMMILYVSLGCNKSKLARVLGCSRPFIQGRLKEIQTKLKDIIKQRVNKENYELF